MTREEQKQIADFVRSLVHEIITESGTDKNAHTNEVLRKTADRIEKMDTEPCEDAISRAAAIKKVSEGLKHTFVEYEDIAQKMFADLPSVTPKQKMGRWKVASDGYGDNAYICECSECKDTVWVYKDADRKWNYCPNCGAKMAESEDTE